MSGEASAGAKRQAPEQPAQSAGANGGQKSVRSWQNVANEWGSPVGVPDWLDASRAEITWSTRLQGFRVHFTGADGAPQTAQPGDWILIDHEGGLHVATDTELELQLQILVEIKARDEGDKALKQRLAEVAAALPHSQTLPPQGGEVPAPDLSRRSPEGEGG